MFRIMAWCLVSVEFPRHSKLTNGTCLAIITKIITIFKAINKTMSDISRKNAFLGWNVLELTSNSWRWPLLAKISYFYEWRYYTNPYKKGRLNCRRVLVSLPKNPFRGFKRQKGFRGTSGRPVNIDFRFRRIFLRIDALLRNWFQGVARYPLLPTRLVLVKKRLQSLPIAIQQSSDAEWLGWCPVRCPLEVHPSPRQRNFFSYQCSGHGPF